MTNTTTTLIRELNTLLRLTNTETTIAQTRQSQARDTATRRELAGNAKDALQRAQQLREAIRKLGGVPDVLGIALGRAGALAKTQLEQGQLLTDALLGDLQLEHQLRDRAAFVRMLAETAGNRDIARLGERLEKSHTETIEWIRTRLAEVAVGSPVAIQPTPVQAAVGAVRRVAAFPARQAAVGVNRSVQLVSRLSSRAESTLETGIDRAQERIETNLDKGRQLAEAAGEILGAGRDAALERTEDVARDEGARRTAKAARTTRRKTGALNADELPIRGYDELNADQATDRIERLEDATDVRAVLAYEQANKGRKSVVKAANAQLTRIADVAKNGGSIRANRREEMIDLTVDELRDRAAKADIEGRSSMSKDELVSALNS
jgi:bacterioferritin (cytochrome b1)